MARDCKVLDSKWKVHRTLFPLKAQNLSRKEGTLKGQKGWISSRKECFPWHNRAVVHAHSQWLWQHAKHLVKQVSQNSSKEVQKWAQNLTTSWGGNIWTVWHLQFQHTLRQTPSPRVVGQCKCNSMEKAGEWKENPLCG